MPSLLSVFLLLLALAWSLEFCSSRKMSSGTDDGRVLQPALKASSTRFNPSKSTQISWRPRLFLYEGFVSDEECAHLIALAQSKIQKASLMNNTSTKTTNNVTRGTSSGLFLPRDLDEIILAIEERISAWTFLPKENGEDLQILHYDPNEHYLTDYGYSANASKLVYAGHRIATVLMYLSNVTSGGETIFPSSELKDTQIRDHTWSECSADGFAVKPVKGNALLFFHLHPNATTDHTSALSGCEVLDGEKWVATKWIHVKKFDPSHPSVESGSDCTDEDDNCSQWADVGECQRNPVFMLGSPDYYGTCRKSCGVC